MASSDRLSQLQQDFEQRGSEALDDLKENDPETYALVMAEAVMLLEEPEEEAAPEPAPLKVYLKKGESESRGLSRSNCTPEVLAAECLRSLAFNSKQPVDINDLVAELEYQTSQLKDGAFGRTESMLSAQSHTLDAMFNNLTRRALTNIEAGYSETGREYLKLAMKAQTQCRSTVESLAEIRRPVIKQTNIAHGHQQVNNFENPPNKLLEQRRE